MAITTLNEDTVSRAIQFMLQRKATEQRISEAAFRRMQFKVASQYDLRSMRTVIRVAWQDPDRPEVCRALDHQIDDHKAREIGLLSEQVLAVISSIDIRGELYFFRLNGRFPKRVGKVEVTEDGAVRVTFKNGRVLSTNENELDTPEFLATCAMVYDL
jgi:hypothetical protein